MCPFGFHGMSSESGLPLPSFTAVPANLGWAPAVVIRSSADLSPLSSGHPPAAPSVTAAAQWICHNPGRGYFRCIPNQLQFNVLPRTNCKSTNQQIQLKAIMNIITSPPKTKWCSALSFRVQTLLSVFLAMRRLPSIYKYPPKN